MARKTKHEAAQTRRDILDAAEMEMQARGVSGASFSRIAQRANVTRGAIYWHFADKDALLTAMVERTYLPLRDLKHSLREQQPDRLPGIVLRDMLQHGLERLATDAHHRRVCHIIVHCREDTAENHPVARLLRQSFEDSRIVIRDLCREAEHNRQLKPHIHPEGAADMIMAFMFGVYNCSLRYTDLYPAEHDWSIMLNALLDGIFKPCDNPPSDGD